MAPPIPGISAPYSTLHPTHTHTHRQHSNCLVGNTAKVLPQLFTSAESTARTASSQQEQQQLRHFNNNKERESESARDCERGARSSIKSNAWVALFGTHKQKHWQSAPQRSKAALSHACYVCFSHHALCVDVAYVRSSVAAAAPPICKKI